MDFKLYMKTASRIPRLIDPMTSAEFAGQVGSALAEVGCAYIPAPHLSPYHLLNPLRAFFALTPRQKQQLTYQLASPWQGAWVPLGVEQLADSPEDPQEDHKEVLDLNLENGTYARWLTRHRARRNSAAVSGSTSTSEAAENAALGPLTALLCQMFQAFQNQADRVLGAIETQYSQPKGSLVSQHGHNSTLRLLHYPPAPHFTLDSIRLGAHRDYSGITLLWQDATGGLEILTPQGDWTAVNIPPGHIGVLVGEVMQRWSGDTLHAAPHRVRVTHPRQLKQTRFSIAFFCETNADCVVRPGALLNGVGATGAQPIAIEAFLNQKYDQIFANASF